MLLLLFLPSANFHACWQYILTLHLWFALKYSSQFALVSFILNLHWMFDFLPIICSHGSSKLQIILINHQGDKVPRQAKGDKNQRNWNWHPHFMVITNSADKNYDHSKWKRTALAEAWLELGLIQCWQNSEQILTPITKDSETHSHGPSR